MITPSIALSRKAADVSAAAEVLKAGVQFRVLADFQRRSELDLGASFPRFCACPGGRWPAGKKRAGSHRRNLTA